MTWLFAGKSYDGSAITDVYVESACPTMVDRAYVETQLYLPHMLRRNECFERHPKLRV